jgi:hypothetical protein
VETGHLSNIIAIHHRFFTFISRKINIPFTA